MQTIPMTTRPATIPPVTIPRFAMADATGNRARGRSGLTLTELLVVITVLSILAAMTVRTMNQSIDGSQIREAARIVSSTLTAARNRAQQSERAAGITFEVLPNNTASLNMIPVEEPPPYGGDTTASKISFSGTSIVGRKRTVTVTFHDNGGRDLADLHAAGIISRGDRLQLDHRGNIYWITSADTELAAGKMTLESAVAASNTTFPGSNTPVSFQIFRRPRPSAAPPVQLPNGAVIDLVISGYGYGSTFGNPSHTTMLSESPITLMFNANGSVQQVFYPYHDGSNLVEVSQAPSSTYHFHIGRIDQIDFSNSANLGDLNNRWVSVNSQTGMVGVYENATVFGGGTTPQTLPQINGVNVAEARQFVRTGKSVGE